VNNKESKGLHKKADQLIYIAIKIWQQTWVDKVNSDIVDLNWNDTKMMILCYRSPM